MKIVVGGDSAGKPLADILVKHLAAQGHEVIDLGAQTGELYANLADRGAKEVLEGRAERGILCCGTGIGVAISANKVPGIRAAQTHDTYSAERAAKSNNAHFITMGARVIGSELAKAIADKFLESDFDPKGASVANVDGISSLDAKYTRCS
ncbi:RpiB/LacA/LacB family sugar-phosphate isomerase [Acidisoma silvae]|uniref:RpiB/LacA/LacB family sugar-phosphate isomerase n=1 Tax=Acidisoma silvae TaxID=2802396 RepID=A0A963YMQ4_9PROT|nr:RpiB/LacA/LacB family sugar-phosphate isomerase [Acidisoma silvae]MCB8873641.1 RpiB/LacA/LacB family sugar-phosphate isomerase [Acidisoma silvae]